jgi:hypothetical protein
MTGSQLSCPTGRVAPSSFTELSGKRLAKASVLFSEGVQFCLEGCSEFAERLL